MMINRFSAATSECDPVFVSRSVRLQSSRFGAENALAGRRQHKKSHAHCSQCAQACCAELPMMHDTFPVRHRPSPIDRLDRCQGSNSLSIAGRNILAPSVNRRAGSVGGPTAKPSAVFASTVRLPHGRTKQRNRRKALPRIHRARGLGAPVNYHECPGCCCQAFCPCIPAHIPYAPLVREASPALWLSTRTPHRNQLSVPVRGRLSSQPKPAC